MEVADNVILPLILKWQKSILLGLYFDNADYSQKSKQMLTNVQQDVIIILSIIQLGTFRNAFIKPPFEIAIVGLKTPES
jgi:uncharacterized radical SAM superfamily protein